MAVRKPARQVKTVKEAVAAVANVTPKTALDKLNAAKLAVNEKLAEVDVALLDQIQEMQNLDTVIAERKAELKDLFAIEADAETLQLMKEEHERWKVEAEQEKADTIATETERQAERDKKWLREQEEHAYEIAQRNARDEATLKAQSEARQREERIRMDDVNRSLEQRIAAVEEREAAAAAKADEIANMPKTIASAVEKAVADATTQLKQQNQFEKALAAKDAENRVGLLQSELVAVKAALAASEARNAALVTQAAQAVENAKAIAMEAVNASSGRQALAAVQNTVANPATATPARR